MPGISPTNPVDDAWHVEHDILSGSEILSKNNSLPNCSFGVSGTFWAKRIVGSINSKQRVRKLFLLFILDSLVLLILVKLFC
jgi:hypothetical protein